MRGNEAFKDEQICFDNYLNYMHGQVEELCRDYGKIDILWFDFSYDDLRGEAWRASELMRMVRSYQPHVIVDNRLEVSGEGFGSIATDHPTEYSGDFVSPEQIIPPTGFYTESGLPIPWEACITMNDNWGYAAKDKNFKPADMLIRKLVECVSKNGNLLLNVGPDARGRIPEESLKILSQIGKWMRDNSESIYGCGSANLPKPENGRITAKGKTLYYHIYEKAIGHDLLENVPRDQIRSIRLLRDGTELSIISDWIVNNYPDAAFVKISNEPFLPDPIDTVVKIELK